jgi:hypothetical protein
VKHLRGDVLYLIGFAVVAVVGYAVATQMATDEEMFAVDPNYRPAELGLPEYSVDMKSFPFAIREVGAYAGPTIPRRWFADEMESALASVRRSILNDSVAQSARLQEPSASDQLAAVSP